MDSEKDEEFILGPAGAQFVKTHAIKTSNDTFNVVMTLVCAMASLTNGATIAMFPGQDSPLNCVAVLVGFLQTQKSQMTGLLQKVATEIDRHVRDTVQAKLVDTETTVNAVQIATVKSCKMSLHMLFSSESAGIGMW